MFFLHGGGWLCGSGNSMWYGPSMLMDKDVVLVVPNYRLGASFYLIPLSRNYSSNLPQVLWVFYLPAIW